MGFSFRPEVPATGAGSTVGKRIKSTGVNAARRKFTPEFINRLDKIVVVNPLGEDELLRVLDLELRRVQHRVFDDTPFLFRLTHAAKASLLADGFDAKYGARHRTISRLPDVQPDCRGPSDGGRSRRRPFRQRGRRYEIRESRRRVAAANHVPRGRRRAVSRYRRTRHLGGIRKIDA